MKQLEVEWHEVEWLALAAIRDLHGITDRGNRWITAVKTAVMGNGFPLLPR